MKVWLILLMTILISACKPPKSGESVGFLYPYWQWKISQQTLNAPLIVPVSGVKPNQIADTWGAARSEGRKHQGVDIFAKRGTPVMSTTQGIVYRVGANTLGGKVIWVLGPDSSRHYYAHLDDYALHIEQGDWVEVGEVLGYVGNTGNARSTPPHLHYGIYLKNGATNPYPFLSNNKVKK